MPREKRPKARSMESLRHAEYYDMQRTFDELYARSQAGEIFDDLMDLILSKENIMLAYRNIKANSGSATPGTDRLRITDIGRLSADEVVARVRKIVNGGRNGYTPRSVRRKEIPKPNGKTRPLGIPCIWDRLIQQCIKQVMEPVCEAKFSSNSYGFRPNRSVENAIAAMYRLMQRSGLYYVVEFDIKGFFDNVDHTKLIRQLWSLNIRDKKLLHVIRRILKAPIQMPDGHLENPKKGTPQGGIISPLLANVVLNELDHWVESQWQNHPVIEKYSYRENAAGCPIHSHAYRAMRNTNLKEKLSEGKGEGYARWAKRYNLKEMSKTLIFLQENKIGSIEEMQERVDAATARYHELGDSIKGSEKRLAEIAVLKAHITNYAKTRPVYDAYRKSGYSKKFLEAHREQITLHKAAKAAFDEASLKKLPKVKELDAEYAALLSHKKAAYPAYRKARDEMQELKKAQKNVELFFAEEKDPKEKSQTR